MAFNKYESMILSVLLSVLFFSGTDNRAHGKLSSPGLIPHHQHKHVNPHVIKTFQEDNGDIVDCFDIYKQPALSHSKLKGHHVQLKEQNLSLDIFLEKTKCPNGFVPIKRISNEDLMTAEYLNYSSNSRLTSSEIIYSYDAMVEYRGKLHGARGHINVWGLSNVSRHQMSSASIYIQDGPVQDSNTIMAGWMVKPHLFGDSKTRLFVFWNVNGNKDSNCYNHVCPGFVQVSSKVYLGAYITPLSIYDGQQYEINIQIYQDLNTGNWWLTFGNEHVGYWPKSLFTVLQDGGHYAAWGGHIITPKGEPNPPMGSGVLPKYTNRKEVAYIRQIQVNNDGNYNDPGYVQVAVNFMDCYNADYRFEDGPYWGHHVIFGGASGCLGNPPM